MKKFDRQKMLIGGAALCLLVAVMTLFSGSGDAPPPTPPATADAGTSPPPEPSGEANMGAPPADPEFYQRVRQQLLAIQPEHQEPFVARERAAPTTSSASFSHAESSGATSLPVLPLTLQPTPPVPSPLPSEGEKPEGKPNQESPKSSASPDPSQAAHAPPRLRGQIRDHASGKIAVLFELDGALLWASNEPHAEWRIVSIEPRQITIRNGARTLVLEVPYAP
ncbi:MAG: hypothetical protein ABDI19_00590 [Armatimonadota bacterium]